MSSLPKDIQGGSSILSLDNLAQVVVTTASSRNNEIVNTSSSQTLLLAVPQNLNFNQFSNQTLNLDYNSQQLLHSLLQLSTSTDSSQIINTSTSTVEDRVDDSHELVIDIPNNTVELTDKQDAGNSPDTTILPQVQDHKSHKKTIFNEKQNIEEPKNAQQDQTTENFEEEEQSELPTAAINVDMINGQPLYTIQLNGISIPIAAITIPTSEGPRHLQSAITSLPHSSSSSLSKLSDQPSTKPDLIPSLSSHDEAIQSEHSSPVDLSKTKYTCQVCGKSYMRAWSYYGHLREHLPSCEHKCGVCSKQFECANSLKSHMLSHQSSDNDKFTCGLCGRSFPNINSLKTHQQSHKEKTFKCKIEGCEKSFQSASALKTHQRVHQEEKPFKCTTMGCTKAFKTSSELSRHQFRHTGEKPYKCDKCDKSFVRNDDLKRHSFIHTGQKRFKCDQCEFSCIQSFDLVKHKYIHGGEKPYKCKQCPKEFTRPARLREHERLHTGERPYKCDECDKCFTQMTSLKSHKLTHKVLKTTVTLPELTTEDNTKFKCSLCNKYFVSEKTLKRHAIVHSGEKPFECEVCHKRFARAGDLKVHMPVHNDEKPYKCEQCDRSFTRFSSLKEHVRLHTGEFPYKCHYCGKVFNHRSHMNVHLRSHTGERPYKCQLCTKEFSRNISLKQHLRTHGVSEVSATMTTPSMVDNPELINNEDVDNNFSENSYIEGSQTIQLNPSNLHIWKTLQNVMKPLKRKRDESEGAEEESELLPKRLLTDTQLTDYPSTEQMLSSISTNTGQLQGAEVAVINTSNVETVINSDNPEVIFQQLPSGQLAQSHYLNSDGATVAFSLTEGTDGGVEGLVGIHGLDGIQGLDTQALIEQQQHPLNQHLQQDDINGM